MALAYQRQRSSKTDSSSPPWSMSSRSSSEMWNDKSTSSRNGEHHSYRTLQGDQQHPTNDMLQNNDRLHLLKGKRVYVSVKDGSMYKGILYGESSQEELGIVLHHPRKVHEPINATSSSSVQAIELSQSILIKSKDLVSIASSVMDDVDNGTSCGDKVQFGELYKLHEWDDRAVDNLISLDDDASFSNTSCDQPTANQPSFEVKQSLDHESCISFLDHTVYDSKELEIPQQSSAHISEEHVQLVEEDIMDEENGSSEVIRRAPADYFVNHKVQVFPATESDVIYHSIRMNESTTPTFAPSPITNHACAREKKKKKDEQSVTKIFRRCTRTLRTKRYPKKYAQKLKNKEEHLAELVNFHQTFKLDFPIPADIEPLLSESKRANSMPDDNDFERLYDSQQNTTTTSSITVKGTAIKKKFSFKFNVYADEFKPDPAIQELLASRNRAEPPLSYSTCHRSKLKKADTKHLSLYQVFKHPFYKTSAKIPPNDIGPFWPFGTTQYNMQFMARTIENGNVYDRPFTTHLPYTCIQYQYPHHHVASINSTPPYHHNPTYYTTDPQFAHSNLASPTSSAIQSFTKTATSLVPLCSPEAPNTAFYTPLLPDTGDFTSELSLYNDTFHQQQEEYEYQVHSVSNAETLQESPYFMSERTHPAHFRSPATDTMIQLTSRQQQPIYTGSEYSYWQL